MSLRDDPSYFPQPDVPNDGNYGSSFGREQLYYDYLPRSASIDTANAAAGEKTYSSGKYTFNPATGQYIWVPAGAATSNLGGNAGAAMGGVGGGVGGGGDGRSLNPGWDALSNAEKAAYYSDNPTMAGLTQGLQKGFGMTSYGMLQNAMFPNFVAEQASVARGIDPATGLQVGGYGSQPGTSKITPTGLYGDQFAGQQSTANRFFGGLAGRTEQVPARVETREATPVDFSSPTVNFGKESNIPTEGIVSPGMDTGPSVDTGSGFTGADSNGGFGPATSGEMASGGMIGHYAQGGLGSLGGYSDGGRLLRGPGDGVSDSIPATIGKAKQPARLADGEFVVPSRIVSELGNGSTEAGARKLYAMLARIQAGRKKSIGRSKVAVNSRMDKYLPA